MNIEYVDDDKIFVEIDGKEKECDVLFTLNSDDTMKSYIGYTDHSFGDNGRKNIFVSAINPFKPEVCLEKITDEAELQMIYDSLVKIDNEIRNG